MYDNLTNEELQERIAETEKRIKSIKKQINGKDENTIFINLEWAQDLLGLLYPRRDGLYKELNSRKT